MTNEAQDQHARLVEDFDDVFGLQPVAPTFGDALASLRQNADERSREYERMRAERDAYRSALANLVMWTHPDKRDQPQMETMRLRARDLLKHGPKEPK